MKINHVMNLLNHRLGSKRKSVLIVCLIGNTLFLATVFCCLFVGLASIGSDPANWWNTQAKYEPYIYLLAASILVETLLLYGILGIKAVYLLILMVGIALTLSIQVFDPIDESGHYSLVQILAEQQRWPSLYDFNTREHAAIAEYVYPGVSFINPRSIGGYNLCTRTYEAFQPPFYYIGAAFVHSMFPGNLAQKLHGVRLMGVSLLLIAIFFSCKTIALIRSSGRYSKASHGSSNIYLFALLVMIYGSAAVLWRVCTVGYSPMALATSSVFCYAVVRTIVRDAYDLSDAVLLGAIAGFCMLSQYTSVVLFGMGFLVLVWQRRYALTVVYFLVFLMILSPWLLDNIFKYGSLTGAGLGKELQLATGFKPPPFSWHLIVNSFYSLFTKEILVVNYPFHVVPWTTFWSWSLGALIFWAAVYGGLRSIISPAWNDDHPEKLDLVIAVSSLTFWSTLGLIIVMSFLENMGGNLGIVRYSFPAFPFLIIILYFALIRIPKIARLAIVVTILGFVSFSWTSIIVSHILAADLPGKILKTKNRFVSLEIVPGGDGQVWPTYNGTFAQSFVADYDNLCGVNFLVKTLPGRQPTPHRFRLMDHELKVLREEDLDSSRIRDMDYYEVTFPSVTNSAKRMFWFTVVPATGTSNSTLLVFLSGADCYTKGQATINGNPTGRDAVFELVYHYNPWFEATPPAGYKGRPFPTRLLKKQVD